MIDTDAFVKTESTGVGVELANKEEKRSVIDIRIVLYINKFNKKVLIKINLNELSVPLKFIFNELIRITCIFGVQCSVLL